MINIYTSILALFSQIQQESRIKNGIQFIHSPIQALHLSAKRSGSLHSEIHSVYAQRTPLHYCLRQETIHAIHSHRHDCISLWDEELRL